MELDLPTGSGEVGIRGVRRFTEAEESRRDASLTTQTLDGNRKSIVLLKLMCKATGIEDCKLPTRVKKQAMGRYASPILRPSECGSYAEPTS